MAVLFKRNSIIDFTLMDMNGDITTIEEMPTLVPLKMSGKFYNEVEATVTIMMCILVNVPLRHLCMRNCTGLCGKR